MSDHNGVIIERSIGLRTPWSDPYARAHHTTDSAYGLRDDGQRGPPGHGGHSGVRRAADRIGSSGSITLSLGDFQFDMGVGRWSNTSFNGGGGWTTCCTYINDKCVNYDQIYQTTYRGSKWLNVSCDSGLETIGFTKTGAVVDGSMECFASTSVCSFSNQTLIACGEADSSGFDRCFRTRRFHVGFSALKDGTPGFGWLQIDGSGWDGLSITSWAYDDSGSPIIVGALPPEPCTGDLNDDGLIDSADLGLLLTAWGSCGKAGPGCFADLDTDGVVNAADIGLLLAEWGSCDFDP